MISYTSNSYTSTTSQTWYIWTATNATTSGATDSTWGYWSGGTLYITPTATSSTWEGWMISDGTCYPGTINGVQAELRQETEEERKQHEEERIRLEELARETEHQKKLIEEKALQLLLESLTENQAEIFKVTGAIPVVCASGRKYRINKGISANVEELDEKNQRKARLCFHPCDCPTYDVMLAQKLALEVCEEEARQIANFS